MPEILQVGLQERSYPIWIGDGILNRIGEALDAVRFPKKIGVVCNSTVGDIYLAEIRQVLEGAGYRCCLIDIPDGEEFKNLQTLEQIYATLIEQGFDRGCGLLALGGGVTGDITGFAAATFMRGVPYVQVPTTLLSQVDSSVGGKTAVNLPLGKNLVGAFYQPVHVHIDVSTLRTLPGREFSAGLAEVAKYGIIRDESFFSWLEAHHGKLASLDAAALIHAVRLSCQIKAAVVEGDEREHALRAILNYGHTFGHAVEALSGYGHIKHGEAVAIGMVFASRLSESLGLCSRMDVERIESLLKALGLPVSPPTFSPEQYLSTMARDKKAVGGQMKFVLNLGIGDCRVQSVSHLGEHLCRILNF